MFGLDVWNSEKKMEKNAPGCDEMIALSRAEEILDVDDQGRRRNEVSLVGWVSADKVWRRQFIRLEA